MRQTLFFIPHAVFQGPLLIAWLVIGAVVLAYRFRKHGNSNETWSFLPVFGIVALVIHFVLPQLEVVGVNPADPAGDFIKLGLAVRGYGMFLLLAIVSGVSIILLRCRKSGLTPDDVIGLGFWMMVSGILGARLFYVIQKSDDFFTGGATIGGTILSVIDMTKGGLVVYGSLIGAMVAAVVYLKLHKLPLARTADLIAPGMVLGLAIGRIGCLMNGCCYGGVCAASLPSVTFPAGSAPYMKQLSEGELIGIKAIPNPDKDAPHPYVVESVEPSSLASKMGIEEGDEFIVRLPDELYIRYQKQHPGQKIGDQELVGYIETNRLKQLVLPVAQLPARSLQTHPTQIYSAINASLLCLVLWFYWTVRTRDGEVFGLMLILYSIGRFLMELIRQDELGQFGTQLTISQWVSIAMILIGFAVITFARPSDFEGQHRPVVAS